MGKDGGTHREGGLSVHLKEVERERERLREHVSEDIPGEERQVKCAEGTEHQLVQEHQGG